MLEVLKSLYITGLSALWRKARPFAAPSAIIILVDHDNGALVSEYLKKALQVSYDYKEKIYDRWGQRLLRV